MNKNLQMVYNYHNQTKHHKYKYARSLGYMDWKTQPNPYREYKGTKKTILPLAFKNKTLPYHQIFEENKNETASLNIDSISQFFQFSLGLAAIKVAGESSWALRCNASSGNLQPTEAYLIANEVEGIENGLFHYAPKNHELELLSSSHKELPIPQDSFLVALSSIVWREAWKYGERSWRYTQLDCGHALKALEISAYILGWKVKTINITEQELASLLGLDQKERYVKEERENPDMLLCISKNGSKEKVDLIALRKCFEEVYVGTANTLSIAWHRWDILDEIEDATSLENVEIEKEKKIQNIFRKETFESKEIVLNRRSVQMMDEKNTEITLNEFEQIIASVNGTINENTPAVNLIFFIHNVVDLKPGLYIMLRNSTHKDELTKQCKDSFLWEKIDTEAGELFLLKKGDFIKTSKVISCSQDIASDSSFSLGMLASFDEQMKKYGAHRYKELYWECGAIGQQLYLEATSLSLSATGIGCYLDDMFHDILGIKNTSFQSLYHFTIGRGIFDSRLSTLKPYENRNDC